MLRGLFYERNILFGKKVIKTKYKEQYGTSKREKGLIIAIYITFICGLLFFLVYNSFFGKLFLFISVGSLIYFYYKLFKTPRVDRLSPNELIFNMKETLTNKNIKSIELIDMLQEEIAKELEKKEREQKILYKRISVVFVSIFWVPFAFLTKYFIEQYSTELTLENYLLLSSSLLVLAMQFIGLVIAIGNQLEDFMSITKKDLLLTNRYLSDIKYLYIMEQEN